MTRRGPLLVPLACARARADALDEKVKRTPAVAVAGDDRQHAEPLAIGLGDK